MNTIFETVWWNEMPCIVLRGNHTNNIDKYPSNSNAFAVLLHSSEYTVNEYAQELYVYWDGVSEFFEFILHPNSDSNIIFSQNEEMHNRVFFSDAYNFLYAYMKKNRFGDYAKNIAANSLALAFELTFISHANYPISVSGDFVGIPFTRKSPSSL